MDEKALAKAGYGGIIGVGQGSVHPPRLVTHDLQAGRATARTPHLALVGKGITFDSGGLCIKPATGMVTMKSDMAGAAAVAAAILVDRRARPAGRRHRLPVPRREHAERLRASAPATC